jgi:hypothetical protein
VSDEGPNLVLEHLRAIRASQEATREDIREIKACLDRLDQRLTLVEIRMPIGAASRGFGL